MYLSMGSMSIDQFKHLARSDLKIEFGIKFFTLQNTLQNHEDNFCKVFFVLIYFFRCTLFSKKIDSLILKTWEDKLIQYLKNNLKITAKDLPKFWNVSKRTARTRIKKMTEDYKIIEFASSLYDPTKWYSLPKKLDD